MPLPNILEFIGINITQRKFQQAMDKLLNFTDELDKRQSATANGYYKSYVTLSAANADIANIPLGVSVKVLSAENGGEYYKASAGATSLTKSPYDPLTQAKAYTDILKALFENKLLTDNLSHQNLVKVIIEIQNFINNQSLNLDELRLDNSSAFQTIIANLMLLSTNEDKRFQNDHLNLNKSFQNILTAINILNRSTGINITQDEKLESLKIQHRISSELAKLNNFNPENVSASTKLEIYPQIQDFPIPTALVRIDLNTDASLPNEKGVTFTGEVQFNIDGVVSKYYAKLEVQGSSSARYPKKNWTMALYNDSGLTKSAKVKIGEVPLHDEWIFKANYVDASHLRNNLSNNLWESMVQSRKTFPKRECDQVFIGKTGQNAFPTNAIGHVVGYPCVMFINGSFYGIGDLNIGKKYFNYNLDRTNAKNIQIDWGANQNDMTKLSTNYLDETFFEIKSPKKVTDETVACLAAWDAFAAMSQADFTANADTYLERKNAVDYCLFSDLLYNYDGLGKNFQFVSWDGTKFNFMPYDLDSVFGLFHRGGTWDPTAVLDWEDVPTATKQMWTKIRTAFSEDIKKRYAELRNNGVFTVSNIYALASELSTKYPKELMVAEHTKWSASPSIEYSNFFQIITWTQARLAYLDTVYNYTA